MNKIILSFLIILFAVACHENKKESRKPVDNKTAAAIYQTALIEKAGVFNTVKLPGQLAAMQDVSIFPKINGYVKSVVVDIGTHVSQHSLLMVLEAPELEQAVAEAKDKYERAMADFAIDKEHYYRMLEAAKTAGAISPLDLSASRAKADADSALCNAAKANWQMQQTMLGYLKVTAPFEGVITERNVHPGALVNTLAKDKPMLELKQVDILRLLVDIPETLVPEINKKDTVSFFVGALPGKKMTGRIDRRSMNMNTQYRSERIEIDVNNKDGLLTPGMYADVIFYTNGNVDALSVPAASVVTSTEEKYVLVVRGNKAVKVDVRTGNTSNGKTEVFGALQAGEKVIARADDQITEGIDIK